MAPEQKSRGELIGPWTDVYLLAMTLAEFIIRAPAWTPEALYEVGAAENAGAISALRVGLARRPDDRPKDAEAFGRLLREALAAA